MATQSQFVAAPVLDFALIGTADTAATAPTAVATVASGPATAAGSGVGKRIARVSVTIPGTTVVGKINWFVSTDGGTTKRLLLETMITAGTGSSTSASFSTTVPGLIGLILPGTSGGNAGQLFASSTTNTGVQIVCESGTL